MLNLLKYPNKEEFGWTCDRGCEYWSYPPIASPAQLIEQEILSLKLSWSQSVFWKSHRQLQSQVGWLILIRMGKSFRNTFRQPKTAEVMHEKRYCGECWNISWISHLCFKSMKPSNRSEKQKVLLIVTIFAEEKNLQTFTVQILIKLPN